MPRAPARVFLLILFALAAVVIVASAESCGLALKAVPTSRAAKSKLRRGQLRLKVSIKNHNAVDVTDAAFQLSLPAGVTLASASFQPKTIPKPRGPTFDGANATWLGIHIKAHKKRRIKIVVNAADAGSNAPLAFPVRAYRHDGTAPLPCEGSQAIAQ